MRFENMNNLFDYIDGYRRAKIVCKLCGGNTSLHLWNFSKNNPLLGMFIRIVCPHCGWFDKSAHKEWWERKKIILHDKIVTKLL
jgi:hypothetical protein